jgi:hypothetical protein
VTIANLTQSTTVATGSFSASTAGLQAGVLTLTLGSGTALAAGDQLQIQLSYPTSTARTMNAQAFVYAQ